MEEENIETKAEEQQPVQTEQEDFAKTIETLKNSFEEKTLKMKMKYEEDIKQRDEVIKQLLTGDTQTPAGKPENNVIRALNEEREKQRKW